MCVYCVEISQLVQSRLRQQLEDFLGTSKRQVGIFLHTSHASHEQLYLLISAIKHT